MRTKFGILAVLAAVGCGKVQAPSSTSGSVDVGCIARAEDIEAKLRCLPRVSFEKVPNPATPNYTRYDIQFEQPENHASPDGKKFRQKLVLLHKTDTDPMLLQTSGYAIFSVGLSNVAQHFGMNQIQVEHRFFATSIPETADWTKLDIEQSAADFHDIAVHFKAIYQGKWLNTGASKGGMTSVYHRRYYPQDLDGTLALVAPLSFSKDDRRYVDFVDNVGGDAYAACRQKLIGVQRELLSRRADVLQGVVGEYDQLGGQDVAFEHAVIELPFAFFQYQPARTACANVPAANATTETLRAFMEQVNGLAGYSDDGMAGFIPYYFQAANQLGGPGANLDVIGDLLRHRETYHLDQYIPQGLPIAYSNEKMLEVKEWVLNESERVMFVYGELDPWSAGAFSPRATDGDSHLFTVAGGNHGSNPFLLNAADKAAALAKLASWLGLDGESEASPVVRNSLEDMEAAYRAKHRL